MANGSPLPDQKELPGFGPPMPTDRDTEVRETAYKIVASSRQAKVLDQIMISTAWVGFKPPATRQEVKDQLHRMTGDGTLTRKQGDHGMYAYSLKKGGAS